MYDLEISKYTPNCRAWPKTIKNIQDISLEKALKVIEKYCKKYSNNFRYRASISANDKNIIKNLIEEYNISFNATTVDSICIDFTLDMVPVLAYLSQNDEDEIYDFHSETLGPIEAGDIFFDNRTDTYFVYAASEKGKELHIGLTLLDLFKNNAGTVSCMDLRRVSDIEIKQFKLDKLAYAIIEADEDEYNKIVEGLQSKAPRL